MSIRASRNAEPQINPKTLLATGAWEPIAPPKRVIETCRVIREKLGVMIDRRLASNDHRNDIAGDLIAARDPHTGAAFDRDELIDQIAVFFLAGHETTASALTWTFFILAQQPQALNRIRAEVAAEVGADAITFGNTRALPFTRNVFRETLRLYPPVSFITRIASTDLVLFKQDVPKGSLIVVSPWLIHRHRRFWSDPDMFDPDRFSPAREKDIVAGTYLPYGLGQRVCTGASFAQAESTLIIAALCRRYEFDVLNPNDIEPVGKLTTRPKTPVSMQLRYLAKRPPQPS